jgi:autotransporter-associated beta strand protein
VINSAATLNVVTSGAGVETFTAANSYVGNTTVAGGTLTIAATGSVISPALFTNSGATLNLIGTVPTTATLTSAGTINIAANSGTGILPITVGGVSATAGGIVTLQDPPLHANRTLLVTSALTFGGSNNAWQGSVNLGGNDLVVHNGNISAMSNQALQGLNASAGGLVSSMAAGNTRRLTAIGVIQNSIDGTTTGPALYGSGNPLGLFDNYSPSNTDVLAKYTYFGDANLDGKVDGSDYTRIDSGWTTQATGWFNGDFNYDGIVNGSDYTLIDNVLNTQGSSLTSVLAAPNASITAELAASSSSVPEPGAVGVLVSASLALLGRRRSICRLRNSICPESAAAPRG